MSFESLGLDPKILATLQKLKYTVATPIQVAAIPAILDGDDLLGCAQTGTGKTAAFSLPILQNLFHADPSNHGSDGAVRDRGSREPGSRSATSRGRERSSGRPISALVLTPTRELANQVSKSFATYGRSLGLRLAVVYGGVSQNPQVTALRAGVDIVVATPGRLLDLIGQGVVDLSQLKVLVLDEADQMLDMGFIQPLKRIVSRIPANRQTLMFSATMPPEIQRLAEQWLNNPITVQANVIARPPDKIKQSVAFVEHSRKADALIEYLRLTAGIRHIVFCRTKRGADRLAKLLERAKISASAIHGNKSQNARERALASFSSETPPILVATDVAARGLHMPGVSHVINYDLPNTPETYVHRIGRTARAGAAGESISFCSGDEREYLRDIERLIGYSIPVQSISGFTSAEPAKASPRATESKTGRTKASRPQAAHTKSPSQKPVRKKFGERNAAVINAAVRKATAVQAIRTTAERPAASPSATLGKDRAPNSPSRRTRPAETRPSEARRTSARPTDSRTSNSRATNSRPADSRTDRSRPNRVRPADSRTDGSRSADFRPGTARPNSARPATARPTGARPTTARPTGARPTTSRPTGARQTGARPTSAGEKRFSRSEASETNRDNGRSPTSGSGHKPSFSRDSRANSGVDRPQNRAASLSGSQRPGPQRPSSQRPGPKGAGPKRAGPLPHPGSKRDASRKGS
jgi:ATP-dependent RNA helicase RhlE